MRARERKVWVVYVKGRVAFVRSLSPGRHDCPHFQHFYMLVTHILTAERLYNNSVSLFVCSPPIIAKVNLLYILYTRKKCLFSSLVWKVRAEPFLSHQGCSRMILSDVLTVWMERTQKLWDSQGQKLHYCALRLGKIATFSSPPLSLAYWLLRTEYLLMLWRDRERKREEREREKEDIDGGRETQQEETFEMILVVKQSWRRNSSDVQLIRLKVNNHPYISYSWDLFKICCIWRMWASLLRFVAEPQRRQRHVQRLSGDLGHGLGRRQGQRQQRRWRRRGRCERGRRRRQTPPLLPARGGGRRRQQDRQPERDSSCCSRGGRRRRSLS